MIQQLHELSGKTCSSITGGYDSNEFQFESFNEDKKKKELRMQNRGTRNEEIRSEEYTDDNSFFVQRSLFFCSIFKKSSEIRTRSEEIRSEEHTEDNSFFIQSSLFLCSAFFCSYFIS